MWHSGDLQLQNPIQVIGRYSSISISWEQGFLKLEIRTTLQRPWLKYIYIYIYMQQKLERTVKGLVPQLRFTFERE